MRDAISMSIDYLKDKGKKDKKVLLVVTDGNDNASNISLEDLVRKAPSRPTCSSTHRSAERRGAARGDAGQARPGRSGDDSGGSRFYPKDLAEIDRIAQRSRTISAISTPSPTRRRPTDGRQLPADQGNGKGSRATPLVRTRTGYYATPDASPKKALSRSAKRYCG